MMLFFLQVIDEADLNVAGRLPKTWISFFVLANHSFEKARLSVAIGLVDLGMSSLHV